jgi:hypothetical protein
MKTPHGSSTGNASGKFWREGNLIVLGVPEYFSDKIGQ